MSGKDETWVALVRRVTRRKHLSAKSCDVLLWGTTCFPFGDTQQVTRQLRRAWAEGGKNVAGALAFANAEMAKALAASKTTGDTALA